MYLLTLIAICFLPFQIYAQIVVAQTMRGGRDTDKKIDIEAGGVLSECVINTKTIYSFNFQKNAVNAYNDVYKILEKLCQKRIFSFMIITQLIIQMKLQKVLVQEFVMNTGREKAM